MQVYITLATELPMALHGNLHHAGTTLLGQATGAMACVMLSPQQVLLLLFPSPPQT